jgi:hypothetical protein
MAYTAGDTILDDEYNNFVNASSSPYGINYIMQVQVPVTWD